MPFIHTLSKRNQREYLNNSPIDFEPNKSYFFHGIPGSGKTTKSLFFTKKWFEFFKITPEEETSQAKFIRFNELIETARKTFLDGQDGANAREEMREIKNYKLLILDDIGTEKNTEFVDKIIYEIINYRFEEELQTIFTSNYSLEMISKNYHDRIASRIGEVCGKNGIIKTKDIDYRQFSNGFIHQKEEKTEEVVETKKSTKKEAVEAMIKGLEKVNKDWKNKPFMVKMVNSLAAKLTA